MIGLHRNYLAQDKTNPLIFHIDKEHDRMEEIWAWCKERGFGDSDHVKQSRIINLWLTLSLPNRSEAMAFKLTFL